MDFTEYLPEKLKIQYDESGTPATVLEKVLELFAQVLSGDVSATYDFESKVDELKNFWNPYGLNDLTKLKRTLDINNIVETVATLNEECRVSSSENSEKAYLKTIPIFNKMKGTLKGLVNVLNLFGITITVTPWYDSEFPSSKYQECGVIINADLEGNVCLTEDSYEIIGTIITTLLDVCATLVELILRKAFITHFDDLTDELVEIADVSSLCLHWDWRTAHPCCNTWGMSNSGNYAFYSSHSLDRCPAAFDHSGAFTHKCHESLWCGIERVDIAVVDPIIRSVDEVPLLSVIYQSDHTLRCTVPSGLNMISVNEGDAIIIENATNSILNGDYRISYVEAEDYYFEIVHPSIVDSSYDEIGSTAVVALNIKPGVNRVILDHGYPVRTVVYDDPFIPGVDLGDSVGDGTLYAANELIGDQWVRAGDYWECPDLFSAKYSILNTDRLWSMYEVDSIGSEYYLVLDQSGIPDILPEPANIFENDVMLTRGTLGDLKEGEWDFGYDTVVGYDTIFIKLSDGSNPNTKSDNYLEASVLKEYCTDVAKDYADETNYLQVWRERQVNRGGVDGYI